MTIRGTRNFSPGARIMIALSFAAMTAFFCSQLGAGPLMRAACGLAVTGFLFAFFGNHKAFGYEAIPILFALTLPTLLPFSAGDAAPTLWMVAAAGFAFLGPAELYFFALLSKRPYRFRDACLLYGIFLAVAIAVRYWGAPLLLHRFAPQLPDQIGNFRFLAVAAGLFVACVTAWIVKKDWVAGLLPLLIGGFGAAAAIGAALLCRRFFPDASGSGFLIGNPRFGLLFGALFGLPAMLLTACLPRSVLEGDGKFKYRSPIGGRGARFAYHAFLVLFPPLLLAAALLATAIAGFLPARGASILPDPLPAIALFAVLGLAALILSIACARKNLLVRCLHVPVKRRLEDCCLRATPAFVLAALPGQIPPCIAALRGTLPKTALLPLCAALLFFLSYAVAAACVKAKKH